MRATPPQREDDPYDSQETALYRRGDRDRRRVDCGSGPCSGRGWRFRWRSLRWRWRSLRCGAHWRLRWLPRRRVPQRLCWRARLRQSIGHHRSTRLCPIGVSRSIGLCRATVLPQSRVLCSPSLRTGVVLRRQTRPRMGWRLVLDLGADRMGLATSLGLRQRLGLLTSTTRVFN
jgi:hypothetical protein